jgi:hypothetical protein
MILFLFAAGINGLGQDENAGDPGAYQEVFMAAQAAVEHDPFIRNGIYYTYPYYNAQGHPFLDTKEFGTGSAHFRGKYYDGLSINYDLFNQLVILSWEYDGVLQMSLLAPEFLEGFQLKDKLFVKADMGDGSAAFFQVVSRAPGVACYHAWYKERREIRDSGNRSIYSFSEQKRRNYLLVEGRLQRYKSNRSFVKLFPEAARDPMRSYIIDAQIDVMDCSNPDMERLISYASTLLEQNREAGGE